MPKINKVNVRYTYFVFGNLQIAPPIEMTSQSCSLLRGKKKKVQFNSPTTRDFPRRSLWILAVLWSPGCGKTDAVHGLLSRRLNRQVDLLPPHLRMRVRQQAIVTVRTSNTAIGHFPGQSRRSSAAIGRSSMANGTGYAVRGESSSA